MKKGSASLAMKEMQINMTLRFCLTPDREPHNRLQAGCVGHGWWECKHGWWGKKSSRGLGLITCFGDTMEPLCALIYANKKSN
jgi:hypothetical protein